MIKQKQLFPHEPSQGLIGDCYRTSIACLLDLDASLVPNFVRDRFDFAAGCVPDTDALNADIQAWLGTQGYRLVAFAWDGQVSLDALLGMMGNSNPDVYYLLSGTNPRNVNHAVIGCGADIVWDPSTTARDDEPALIGPCSNGMYLVEFLVPLRMIKTFEPVLVEHAYIEDEPRPEDEREPGTRCEMCGNIGAHNVECPVAIFLDIKEGRV